MTNIPLPDPGAHIWPGLSISEIEAFARADETLVEVGAKVYDLPLVIVKVYQSSARRYVERYYGRSKDSARCEG